jgi:hypothetical protein
MAAFWQSFYSWASVQPIIVKLALGITLAAMALYIFGYFMSILFMFYLRATEEKSTRFKISGGRM